MKINKDLYINSFLSRVPTSLLDRETGHVFYFPREVSGRAGHRAGWGAGDRGLQKELEKACDFLGVGNINILSE